MKQKFLIVLLAIISAISLTFGITACTGNTDDLVATEGLEYTLSDDGTYYIVSDIGTATDTDIVIASTYEDLPVKEIKGGVGTFDYYDSAFSYCDTLTSIVIPDSVTTIGAGAFIYCTSLAKVTIGNGVTAIGEEAFANCSSLTSVTLPDSVTETGSSAFRGCSSLEGVYITDIAAWCNISFNNGSANPLYYAGKLYLNNELVTELVIPDSVTSIGYGTFFNCTSLTSIVVPDSVTEIGEDAFYGCTSLTCVTLPDSVIEIGALSFRDCSSLTSITIPDSVTEIGEGAFAGCSALESINVDSENTVYHSSGNCLIETESKTLIAGCKNSVIPSDGSVTSIGNYAFEGCTSLTSITIPDSVSSIGNYAFAGCASLTGITIPDSVTEIGGSAFYNCSALTRVTFENTNGWSANGTSIASSDLADPATAAEYMTDTYYRHDWYRN